MKKFLIFLALVISFSSVLAQQSYDGKICTAVYSNGDVLVDLQTPELKQKHLFILNGCNTNISELNGQNVHIEFFEHGIILTCKEKRFSYLVNGDNGRMIEKQMGAVTQKINGLVHIFNTSESYLKFDLSKMVIDKESSPLKTLTAAKLIDSGNGTSCDSGGVGSTSCSVSSSVGDSSNGCSVSCGTGYYACCKRAGVWTNSSCSCIKN